MADPKKKGMLEIMMEKMRPSGKMTMEWGKGLGKMYETKGSPAPVSDMFDPKKSKFAAAAKAAYDRFKNKKK